MSDHAGPVRDTDTPAHLVLFAYQVPSSNGYFDHRKSRSRCRTGTLVHSGHACHPLNRERPRLTGQQTGRHIPGAHPNARPSVETDNDADHDHPPRAAFRRGPRVAFSTDRDIARFTYEAPSTLALLNPQQVQYVLVRRALSLFQAARE